jgi:hypothetical protein
VHSDIPQKLDLVYLMGVVGITGERLKKYSINFPVNRANLQTVHREEIIMQGEVNIASHLGGYVEEVSVQQQGNA